MRVDIITHPSGDQLPILLDNDGLPIPTPNEFILSRRTLSTNTLTRNLRELAVLYRWLAQEELDLWSRLRSGKAFTEAEIKGGLVERLRWDQTQGCFAKKIAVSPSTFNQRLSTVSEFIDWCFNVYLVTLPLSDCSYKRIGDQKERVLTWLKKSFKKASPTNKAQQKGLTKQQVKFLVHCLDPESPNLFGRDPAVRFRNYVASMIMLNYGLRPGELLSLRVEDIEFGAISCIRVTRRLPDPNDSRMPRPSIKRNGRILPIDNPVFVRRLDAYIMTWREELESHAEKASDYLILSDEGYPLSQSSITQFFQIIRTKFPNDLPPNLTAKSLRHTFSNSMEQEMRIAGLGEERRKQALAQLRGDSSLESQEVYIAGEIKEQTDLALRSYHRKLLG